MVASRTLGYSRGLSENELKKIDALHEEIDAYVERAIIGEFDISVTLEVLTEFDFQLQSLWEFPQDEKFHTLGKNFFFKKNWYGRKFQCMSTGVEVVLGLDVHECQFIPVGDGAIDLGRYGAYSRIIGNVKEIL